MRSFWVQFVGAVNEKIGCQNLNSIRIGFDRRTVTWSYDKWRFKNVKSTSQHLSSRHSICTLNRVELKTLRMITALVVHGSTFRQIMDSTSCKRCGSYYTALSGIIAAGSMPQSTVCIRRSLKLGIMWRCWCGSARLDVRSFISSPFQGTTPTLGAFPLGFPQIRHRCHATTCKHIVILGDGNARVLHETAKEFLVESACRLGK